MTVSRYPPPKQNKNVRPEAKSVRVCFAVRCIELFFDSGSCGVPLWNSGLAPIYKDFMKGFIEVATCLQTQGLRAHSEKMMDTNTAHS